MIRSWAKTILLIILIILLHGTCFADGFDVPGQEIYRIRIQNKPGGLVQVSLDQGNIYYTVGRVRTAANARITGFAASSYMDEGTVAATAVHGIRIKSGQSAIGIGKAQQPLMFSIVPLEFSRIPSGYGGHIPRSSGILTDIYTGHSIFRNQSPYTGNPVYLEVDHSLQPMPQDYIPTGSETFMIIVQKPATTPKEIDFENHIGGKVTAVWPDGTSTLIAEVDRAVRSVGRFDGTTFNGAGTINTNHGGVLTISTAPMCPPGTKEGGDVETRGGFMVQPYYHDHEQGDTMTQVMVVGPKDKTKPVLEGKPPLFHGFINLFNFAGHPKNSYRAEVRIDDGDWEAVPAIVGKVANALTAEYLQGYFSRIGKPRQVKEGVTAIRLLLPEYDPQLIAKDLINETSAYTKRAISGGTAPQKGSILLYPTKPIPDGGMVDFCVDGRSFYLSNKSPFRYSWDSTTLPNGFHEISMEISSSEGEKLAAETRRILVIN